MKNPVAEVVNTVPDIVAGTVALFV